MDVVWDKIPEAVNGSKLMIYHARTTPSTTKNDEAWREILKRKTRKKKKFYDEKVLRTPAHGGVPQTRDKLPTDTLPLRKCSVGVSFLASADGPSITFLS